MPATHAAHAPRVAVIRYELTPAGANALAEEGTAIDREVSREDVVAELLALTNYLAEIY